MIGWEGRGGFDSKGGGEGGWEGFLIFARGGELELGNEELCTI